jgi:hypothetical protein
MRILPLNPRSMEKGYLYMIQLLIKEKKEGKKKKKRNFNNASKKISLSKLHSVRVPKTELYPRSLKKD